MSQTPNTAMAVIGIDIGKNSFHVVGDSDIDDAMSAIAFETQSSMQLSRPPTHRGADHRRSLELDTWL